MLTINQAAGYNTNCLFYHSPCHQNLKTQSLTAQCPPRPEKPQRAERPISYRKTGHHTERGKYEDCIAIAVQRKLCTSHVMFILVCNLCVKL